ncbi:phosphoribosylformylglycinamidine cyclo-ligase [Dehalococcoidia bacterium]|nr:phosphoribosylformylglycinamidine cyclo-ligase [Dehalococcoidia bacterium]
MNRDTYLAAGVDRDAAQAAKESIIGIASKTLQKEVVGGVGFFGGMYELQGYNRPVLVSSTDSPGTKLRIANLTGRFDTVGVDLVNHCVNDVFVSGAKPIFFLDYIGVGTLDTKKVEDLVSGAAKACQEVGCSLIGGETAELPGIYTGDEFDMAGFAVGVVEKDKIINGSTIVAGDILLGLVSSGLHTNGYSLARKVFNLEANPSVLDTKIGSLDRSLGESLMEPHRCYYPLLQPVLPFIKGMSHITGGGIPENMPRILPSGLGARFDKSTWTVPPIFNLIQETGNVEETEMFRVFNMGIGMVLACDPSKVKDICTLVPECIIIGQVISEQEIII